MATFFYEIESPFLFKRLNNFFPPINQSQYLFPPLLLITFSDILLFNNPNFS